ncbi:MAG TPA: hypothetical protein VGC21_02735 [Telluria sp.]|jgi:hypothetical protein
MTAKYDYERLFQTLIAAIAAEGSITARMHTVIAECARQIPHADWEHFSGIDFETDESDTEGWLAAALPATGAEPKRAGLWFGLCEMVNDDDSISPYMYVGVSPSFAVDSLDWARQREEIEMANYLDSVVLPQIHAGAYGRSDGLGHDAGYPLVLAYSAIVVHSLLRDAPLPAPLQTVKGATIGYDSGDWLLLGRFKDGKYEPDVNAG